MTIRYKEKAKAFAYEAHKGQLRKDGVTPFTNHLDDVASIVDLLTGDDELVAVAYLHDTIEDTDVTLEQVKEHFNERIARFVEMESEDKRPHMSEKDSWKLRKEEQINHLNSIEGEDTAVLAVALGDKLSNLRDIKADYDINGNASFNKFNNKVKGDHYWYYNSFYEIISEKTSFENKEPLEEMRSILDEVFFDCI